MNILNPPQNYIDYKCAVHRLEGTEFEEAKRKFYKQNHCEEEIHQCFNWLYNARNEFSLPIEKIEIREADGKKHGRIVPMMIFDIEYWMENGRIMNRKIYMGDQGEFSESGEKSKIVDHKMRAAGEDEDEVPF